jgi:hypothetical protein
MSERVLVGTIAVYADGTVEQAEGVLEALCEEWGWSVQPGSLDASGRPCRVLRRLLPGASLGLTLEVHSLVP